MKAPELTPWQKFAAACWLFVCLWIMLGVALLMAQAPQAFPTSRIGFHLDGR